MPISSLWIGLQLHLLIGYMHAAFRRRQSEEACALLIPPVQGGARSLGWYIFFCTDVAEECTMLSSRVLLEHIENLWQEGAKEEDSASGKYTLGYGSGEAEWFRFRFRL